MNNTSTLERDRAIENRSLKDLKGYKVMATDGAIGKVDDVYFDDVTWTLRYFVVDTGTWLASKRVLVSPTAFTDSDGVARTIATTLKREQIEDAPQADLAKPVSRQFEVELNEHFDWPLYWTGSASELKHVDGDAHLRSMNEVLGYRILAKDGEIGHVEDLIVEERSWIVRLLAIDTRNWLPGRKVVVSPLWIESVRWAEHSVTVDLPRESIKKAPVYDPALPVNRAYEEKIFDYYGRPHYWV